MYVEISPRQSGKTTRLIEAAVNYLRDNMDANIGIISFRLETARRIKHDIRDKLALTISYEQGIEWPDEITYRMIDELYTRRINPKSTTLPQIGHLDYDYWFVDEFAFIDQGRLFPLEREYQGLSMIPTNAYYCTTPYGHKETANILVRWCRENNIPVHFNNPWTEQRLEQEGTLAGYMRDAILGDWVEFMTRWELPIGKLKENWIHKFIKKHRFNSESKKL